MADELTMAQRVKIHNDRELARSRKLFRVRAGFCLLFFTLAASSVAVGGQDGVLFAVPFAGIALIFLMLALDSHGHYHTVSKRRWTALTPRFSHRETNPPAGHSGTQPAASASST